MALPLGLAVLVLGLLVVALRSAGGPAVTPRTVEVSARPSPLPGAPPPGPAGPAGPGATTPGAAPAAPGSGTNAVPPGTPRLDTTTPKLKVTDLDGRFEVTVPRTWLSVPSMTPDSVVWQPLSQDANGTTSPSGFQFSVRWAPSGGCELEKCAEVKVADALKLKEPALSIKTSPDRVGDQPAVRLETSRGDQRLTAWVVVVGDRYWVPQLAGPAEKFDQLLADAQPVLATMSFG